MPASPLSQSFESDALDVALDTLAALTPLRYGGLAALGLASWSPAGLSSWVLEIIDVSTCLPWFHAIIAGTLFSRLLPPLSVKQLGNSATLAPHQPCLIELIELDQVYKGWGKLAVPPG